MLTGFRTLSPFQVPQDFFREVQLHSPLPSRHHWHLTVDKSYRPFPVFVWKRQYAWHILCMLICLKSYFCWDCFDILLSLYGTKIRRHSAEHIVHHLELLGQFVPRTLISLVRNPWLIPKPKSSFGCIIMLDMHLLLTFCVQYYLSLTFTA